jgi:hypothetical protein
LNAVLEPQRFGERYVEGLATQFAPYGALGRQVQRALGMSQRDPQGAIEALLATYPMTAEQVPPRTDVLGEEVRSAQTGAAAFVSPLRYDVEQPEPVREAFRGASVGLSSPPKALQSPYAQGMEVQLTREEQERFKDLAAAELRRYAKPGMAANWLEELQTQARARARFEILSKIPPGDPRWKKAG